MTKSDDKVPALRFKGFTDEWEQRKLLDILEQPVTDGPHETPNLVKKGIPFISAEAIINNQIDFNKKRGYISVEYNKQCNKKYAPKIYDVYMVKSGSTVGKVAILETNRIFNIWSPLAAMRVNHKNSPYFLYYLLQTDMLQEQTQNKSKGGTQPNLSMRVLEKFSTYYTNVEEEKKIANLLKVVDKLISLQQRKEKQIKLLKKAMLQTLFTTKTVPQLRFKGFTDNWEQHKLNSFLVEYKKKTKINNQYPVLTSSRQGIFFQKDYYDGNQIASKNNIGYNIVPRNYFTYRHMSDDTIFHFNINTLCDYGIVSTLYPVFTTNNQLSSSWLYYYLNYGNDMKRYALLQKQGGSRTYMYLSKLKNMSGHIPSVKEQDNVAKMLLKIDNLIALQQNKTKKLENLKQFLLQNMFI